MVGRRDDRGRPLLTARGTLGAEDVSPGRRRPPHRPGAALPAAAVARLTALPRRDRRGARWPPRTSPARTPYFCSGCPHNASTRTADDTLVGVGIGCHAMVALDGAAAAPVGLTQMGGEGAQWLGLAPFTDDRHFMQNLGDGTFHHSGSLAIRAAVAAGVSMTYKLLYNDAVAMTGGQRAAGPPRRPRDDPLLASRACGEWSSPPTTPRLPDPAGRRSTRSPRCATATNSPRPSANWRRSTGVTVLIHDDRCATEERRLRKRGKLPALPSGSWINERVCEGCGDCGEKSTCLSVQPVDTEFGRKTRIHQASCNQDYRCLDGDCPSFLLVEPGKSRSPRRPEPPVALPAPTPRPAATTTVLRMPGIGGHRRRHRLADPADGRPPRRVLRRGPRADRPRAEGRPRRLRRPDRASGPSSGSCAPRAAPPTS